MNRLKMAAVTAAALPMLAVSPLLSASPPAAAAATGTMAGLFGSAPNFNSITVDGSPLCPCKNIAYDFWPGQPGIADGVAALDKWISTSTGKKTVMAFSKGTHSVLGWIRENPLDLDAYTVQFVLLGSPETPGNTYPYEGHKGGHGLPQTGNYDNVYFVVREYDGIADAPYDKFNLLALLNASVSTHLAGYEDLDLDNPDAVYVDPKTGATTLYFRSDVLPILTRIDWLASDEQMAKLDALLRPLIDAAYRRPVVIPAKPPLNARLASVTTDAAVDDTAIDDTAIDGVGDEVGDDPTSGGTTGGAETEKPDAAPEAQTPVVEEVTDEVAGVDPAIAPPVDAAESVELAREEDAETIAEDEADEDTSAEADAPTAGNTPSTAPGQPTTSAGGGTDSAQATSGGRHRAPLKGTKSKHSATADATAADNDTSADADSAASAD